MPLTFAVVVQPCTEHVHVHARGVSDISSGHARTRAKVGRVLVFYSFYEENQAELKQPERLETRGWLVGGSAGASIAESEDVSVELAGE